MTGVSREDASLSPHLVAAQHLLPLSAYPAGLVSVSLPLWTNPRTPVSA